jgi:hypothetical protein
MIVIRFFIVLILGLALPSSSFTQVRIKQITADANLTFTGGSEVLGLPATPSDDTAAASKAYVDTQTGATTQNITLTVSGTSIAPNGSDVINLYGSETSLPVDVLLKSRFLTGFDADFATGSATGTSEEGSPAIVGNRLDLTNGNSNFESSAISFSRDSNITSMTASGNDMAFRLLFRPNWNGNPSSEVALLYISNGSAAATERDTAYLAIETSGQMRFELTNNSGTVTVNVSNNSSPGWQSGRLYEIEVNIDWLVRAELFINGVRALNGNDTSMAGTWAGTTSTSQKIILGGMGGAGGADDQSPGTSNHTVEGLAIFDTVQHTNVTFYTPTYALPGAAAGVESIATILGTNYVEGEKISLVAKEASRFSIDASDSKTAGTVQLQTKWAPTLVEDRLDLIYSGIFWQEHARYPKSPRVETVSLVSSATDFTPLGAEVINILGSTTALPVDVTLNATFNSGTTADFAVGDDLGRDGGGTATPTASSGFLNMNTSGFQTSSLKYSRDGGNWPWGTEGAVRILWKPNFTGSPSDNVAIMNASNSITSTSICNIGVTAAQCRGLFRLYYSTGGAVVLHMYNDSGTLVGSISSAQSVTAGVTYEIEVNWLFGTDVGLYWNGTLVATDASFAGSNLNEDTADIFLGGLNSTAVGSSFGFSNHSYDGVAIFNARQHTTSYTATGLPGSSASVEAIDTIVASNYAEGRVIRIIPREANRFTLSNSVTPTSGQMSLRSTFSPSDPITESIDLYYNGVYWQELARAPSPSFISPTTDNAIVRFDGTSGQIQDSGVIIDDSNNVDIPAALQVDDEITIGDGISTASEIRFETALTGSPGYQVFSWDDNITSHGRGFSFKNNTGAEVLFIEGDNPGIASGGSILLFPQENIGADLTTDRDYFIGAGKFGTSGASVGFLFNEGSQALPEPFDDTANGRYLDIVENGLLRHAGGAIVAHGATVSPFNGGSDMSLAVRKGGLFYTQSGMNWVPFQAAGDADPDTQGALLAGGGQPLIKFGSGLVNFYSESVESLWHLDDSTVRGGSAIDDHYSSQVMPFFSFTGGGISTRGSLVVQHTGSGVSGGAASVPAILISPGIDLQTGTGRIPIAFGENNDDLEIAVVRSSTGARWDITGGPMSVKAIGTGATTELTIATGAVTATQGYHTVDTQSDDASDDLDTITAPSIFVDGTRLVIQAEDGGRTVVAKDGTGNLSLSADCTLDSADDTLELILRSGTWYQLACNDNAP